MADLKTLWRRYLIVCAVGGLVSMLALAGCALYSAFTAPESDREPAVSRS